MSLWHQQHRLRGSEDEQIVSRWMECVSTESVKENDHPEERLVVHFKSNQQTWTCRVSDCSASPRGLRPVIIAGKSGGFGRRGGVWGSGWQRWFYLNNLHHKQVKSPFRLTVSLYFTSCSSVPLRAVRSLTACLLPSRSSQSPGTGLARWNLLLRDSLASSVYRRLWAWERLLVQILVWD